ncbi:MAG: hypothetical protein WBP41_03400 [Saprospiraceae bacterium]
MGIIRSSQLLKRIQENISRKSTGSPPKFARRLGIKLRTWYRILKELREEGEDIIYDSSRSSYVYRDRDMTGLKF